MGRCSGILDQLVIWWQTDDFKWPVVDWLPVVFFEDSRQKRLKLTAVFVVFTSGNRYELCTYAAFLLCESIK